ncbi:MAG: antitoxin family protein [Planctomycetota bacterium]
MKETIDAIYRDGVFKPMRRPKISEGQKVRMQVEEVSVSRVNLLKLAAQVYEGLSEDQINEIEQIALNRRNFFGGRT